MSVIFRKLRAGLGFRPAEWAMFFEALVALILSWIRIQFISPKRWASRLLDSDPDYSSEPSEEQRETTRRVAKAVSRVVRNAPVKLVCLPQAMAARWMLRRRGIAPKMYIGAPLIRDEESEFHAWLKLGDQWIVGHCDESKYAVFDQQ